MKKNSLSILVLVVAILILGYFLMKGADEATEEITPLVSEVREETTTEENVEIAEETEESTTEKTTSEPAEKETAAETTAETTAETEETTTEEPSGEKTMETFAETTTPELLADSNDYLKISSPQAGEILANPFLVKGEAKTAETVYLKVNRTDGTVMFEAQTKVFRTGAEEWGSFAVNLNYVVQNTKEGALEIFEKAEDGRAINKITLPIKFGVSSNETKESKIIEQL